MPQQQMRSAWATPETTSTESAQQKSPPTSNLPAAPPPPAAGTSAPTPGADRGPYKPGNQPPPSIGGGPEPETGGAVIGDEDEGNTGVIKGGDGSKPNE